MVKIKLIISILLVIFLFKAYSAQKNIIIRDAEIEYFLYKVILTVSDGYFRNKSHIVEFAINKFIKRNRR